MSLSGPEALRSLDEALRDIRREEDEIAKRLARSAEMITKMREQEGELLSQLAQVRLDPATQKELAGQISGVEGYVESAAIGLLAGRFAAAERLGLAPRTPPPTTAFGALLAHITGGHIDTIDAGPRSFQPMNVNFGLFPPAEAPERGADGKRLKGKEKALAKKRAIALRALADLDTWLDQSAPPVPT